MHTSTTLVLLLTILALKGQAFLGGSQNECPWDHCYSHFKQSSSTICSNIIDTKGCIELATIDCQGKTDIPLIAFKGELSRIYSSENCVDDTNTNNETTPTPPEPPNTIECDAQLLILPDNDDLIEVNELPLPVTTPEDSLLNVLCSPHYYPTLRHCSLFSYTHLRSFGSDEFQTCSLPGAWYLLKHPDVTIEVTGASDDINSPFTKLEKVNITLQNFACTLDSTINYVATATKEEKLPATFSSDDISKIKALDPIEFHVSADGTVASILAPWLNLTVVIMKSDGFLSVVLRMPGDLIQGTDGLCSNQCPSYALQDIESVKNETCLHDVNSALYACSINTDIGTVLEDAVEDNSHALVIPFVHVCQFNVINSLSYNVLSFMRALAKQYSILPNKAPLITPEPFDPDILPPIIATTKSSTAVTMLSSTTTSSLKTTPTTTTSSTSISRQVTSSTSVARATDVIRPTNIIDNLNALPSSGGMVMVNRLLLISLLLLPLLFLLYRV